MPFTITVSRSRSNPITLEEWKGFASTSPVVHLAAQRGGNPVLFTNRLGEGTAVFETASHRYTISFGHDLLLVAAGDDYRDAMPVMEQIAMAMGAAIKCDPVTWTTT